MRIESLMCLVVIAFGIMGMVITAIEYKPILKDIKKADQSQQK